MTEPKEYTQEEYLAKFGYLGCPNCNSRMIRVNERTKNSLNYKIFICDSCKYVVERKIS